MIGDPKVIKVNNFPNERKNNYNFLKIMFLLKTNFLSQMIIEILFLSLILCDLFNLDKFYKFINWYFYYSYRIYTYLLLLEG